MTAYSNAIYGPRQDKLGYTTMERLGFPRSILKGLING